MNVPSNIAALPAAQESAFVSSPVHAVPLVSLLAALLVTGIGLFALSHGSLGAPLSHIHGIEVTNLAPVEVHPSAADWRAAIAGSGAGPALLSLPGAVETGAGMLGAQLAMPYYSFGNAASRTASTKE